jgi:hypothetical protein
MTKKDWFFGLALRNIYGVFTHFYGAILQVATSKIRLKKAAIRDS